MELLLATAIAAVALGAAWPWLWTVATAARGVEARAQSETQAAYATRAIAEELRLAVNLQPVPPPLSPDRALHISHNHRGSGVESIVIAYDPSRRVLWRKASGTYLADHVTQFKVSYLNEGGEPLAASELASASGLARVALIRTHVTVSRYGQQATRISCMVVGPR